MLAAKLIAAAALCAASASAQDSDIGCFVSGVCGTGSVVGGNDRLADEQECLTYCQGVSTAVVFQWAPSPAKLCTCYSSCGNFGPDPACPDCVGGEVLCDTCFSQGSYQCPSIMFVLRTPIRFHKCIDERR